MVFVVCASLEKACLVAAVTANLERFARLYVGEKRVVILQIDEIATEPRARYYGRTDEVRISNFETSLSIVPRRIGRCLKFKVALICSMTLAMCRTRVTLIRK